MKTYTFRARIGSETVVRVQAASRDDAIEAVEFQVAEDFNNVGPVKPQDVYVEPAFEDDSFDLDLIATRKGTELTIEEVES